jgi:lipoprotein-releasing system ATP-binding protein
MADAMTEPKQHDLVVRGLERTFPTAAEPLAILRGVDVALDRGDALAVTGPSGSGKSTFLYVVGVLDEPTAGSVSILGTDPFSLNRAQQAAFRNAHVGFVFQDHHLLPQCSVLENVLLPTLAAKGAGAAEEERARKLLARVGLGERLTHRPAQLSGGERQRVAVCRALINEPELLLADEPTGNLDQKTAETVGTLLLELSREHGALLICVTHSLELAGRFPRRVHLEEGRFVEVTAT